MAFVIYTVIYILYFFIFLFSAHSTLVVAYLALSHKDVGLSGIEVLTV